MHRESWGDEKAMNRKIEIKNLRAVVIGLLVLIIIIQITTDLGYYLINKNQRTIIDNQVRIIEKMDSLDFESTKWQSAVLKNIIENQNTAIGMHADDMRTLADIRAGLCQPWEVSNDKM